MSSHPAPSPRMIFRRGRRALFYVFVFSLGVNLLMLTAPLYMLQVFDRVLTSRSVDTLIYLTIVAGLALATLALLEIVRGRIMIALGTWIDRQLSPQALVFSIRATALSQGTSVQPVRDVAVVRGFLTGPAVFPLLDSPWTPVFIAVVFLLHPLLGWIATGGAIVLIMLALLNEIVTRRGGQVGAAAAARGLGVAENAVRTADAVRAMGMTHGVVRIWHQFNDVALEAQRRTAQRSGIVSSTARFIRFGLQVGLLGTGAWLVIQGELTAGAMIAGSILVSRALAPIEQAIGGWRSAVTARGAYKRLKALPPVAKSDGLPLPRPKGQLSVEAVSYAHPGQKEPLLKNISFALAPGESLGLIGPTASGKSTLVRVLVGNLKPQMGHVRLDGADMADWAEDDRGQYIGYVPQDVELFGGMVRDNIGRFAEDASDQIIEAAKLAGVHEMVLALPDGYDTLVGPEGIVLSGGQRQRIALARAVYGRPSLVVLDEPNANLDRQGEDALTTVLARLREVGTTIIIVAHRPSVLARVDKVLVLGNGRVERFGPREEILKGVTAAGRADAGRNMVPVGGD